MEVIQYKNINETLYHKTLSNGLEVYLLPKNGYSKTYGIISSNFGSIDTQFKPLNQNEMITVPDGIAHFLEHKMFESEEGDVSEKFAKLGANTNAFTSFCRTSYLFSTIEHPYKCTELLLDLVQNIYLTKDNIEKEKGIINQEISMYDDDPNWQIYFSSIQNLYHHHKIKVDIAGNINSVSNIYIDDLTNCYNTFYHPSNMMLFVVGNINVDQCFNVIENNQKNKHFIQPDSIERKIIDEPLTVFKKSNTIKMDISMEQLILSIKINNIPDNPKDRLKQEICINILLDILFSSSSSIFESLEKEGLINDTFGGSYTSERDYAFIQIGGESNFVDTLEQRLIEIITNIHSIQINDDDFNRVKKSTIGSLIMLLNNPESIGNIFSKYYFDHINFFDIYEVLNQLSKEDINNIKSLLNINYSSITKLLKNSLK